MAISNERVENYDKNKLERSPYQYRDRFICIHRFNAVCSRNNCSVSEILFARNHNIRRINLSTPRCESSFGMGIWKVVNCISIYC